MSQQQIILSLKKSRQQRSKPMNDSFQMSLLASPRARRFTPKAGRKRRERAGARRVHPWRAADLSSLGCPHSSGPLCRAVTTQSHRSPDPMTQRSGSDSHLPGGCSGAQRAGGEDVSHHGTCHPTRPKLPPWHTSAEC